MAALAGRRRAGTTTPPRRAWCARSATVALALCAALTLSIGQAATVVVDGSSDPASRLEVRRVVLPDGRERDLYVLEGDPIVVLVDDDQRIEGRVIEFDPEARELRIVGPGTIDVGGERFTGTDLVIDLRDERVDGRDVLIVTSEIDVWGDLAARLPGQVDVTGGTFSPCARCEQDVWDYGFVARSLQLFPGDRLVARDVTITVRGVGIGRVPLLVIPLAPADRQPRLVIEPGSATRRASVTLRWPYVASGDGLGTVTLRYLAAVDPDGGGLLARRLLGGAALDAHLAWSVEHRHFDDRGAGRASIDYVPALPALDGSDVAPSVTTVRLRYETDPSLEPPLVRLGLDRDDARVRGRWEYDLGLTGIADGVRGRFDARGFIDDATAAGITLAPSYASSAEPRRTLARLRIEPLEPASIDLGPVRVVSAELDLGAFEDVSDPTNRSAAVRPFSTAGRARVAHVTQLDPWRPWAGAQVDARNEFDGRYYDTGERQVRWITALSVRQAFGNAGTLTATFDRSVDEGETPFRFDAGARRNTASFGVRVRLAPAPSWSLEHDARYVLLDTRQPDERGWQPFDTRLELLRTVTPLSLRLRHRIDLDDDLHTLEGTLELRARRDIAEVGITLGHLQDLAPRSVGGRAEADTRTSLRWSVSASRAFALSIETAFRPSPPPDAAGELRSWAPLDVRAELGSMTAGDARPGARVDARIDLDDAVLEQLTVSARARVGPLEVDALQRIDVEAGVVREARLAASVEDRFGVTLRGVAWLPLSLLGIEPGDPGVRTVTFTVRDTPVRPPSRWEANLRTTFDPALGDGAGGRRDTVADLRVALTRERWGPVDVSVDAFAEWRLRDASAERGYLRRAELTFGLEAYERVGLQGTVGYVGAYADALDAFTRSELRLQRVTLSVRATDELSFGAQVSDVWDFTRQRADQSPWNLRPEVFVVWDRCCWALAAAYDTGSGALTLVLTGPGASTGIEEIVPTPFGLERRPLTDQEGP